MVRMRTSKGINSIIVLSKSVRRQKMGIGSRKRQLIAY
jgi:hypothetical protein